jgi:hypothetical protein
MMNSATSSAADPATTNTFQPPPLPSFLHQVRFAIGIMQIA